jgi:membrane protease YdiL (CAAX protease family)
MEKIITYKLSMTEYLDAVYQGKNTWWRYMLSIALILFLWLFIGSIPVLLLSAYLMIDGNPKSGITETGFTGVDPLLSFFVTMSGFVLFFIAIFISVRFIHGRPFHSLITPKLQTNWKRFFAGFVFWFIIAGLVSLFEAILYPSRYEVSFNPGPFLIFSLFAILLIPIQATCEELFFRGYLMQGLGLRFRGIIVLPVISGAIFGVLHLWNPEMTETNGSWLLAGSYFLIGVFAALITLMDGGLELALGLHISNNLYSAMVANYSVSALPSESIFTVNVIDPLYGLISLILAMLVFYLLAFQIFPKNIEIQQSQPAGQE